MYAIAALMVITFFLCGVVILAALVQWAFHQLWD